MGLCKIFGAQAVPSTDRACKFVLIIKVLILLQFAVAVLDIVASKHFLREGIFGLFLPILLFLAFYKLYYQTMMIYTFMCLFFSVVFLVFILQTVQHKENIAKLSGNKMFHFVTACISLGFYLASAIFSFYPYREFKAIYFSQNPAFTDFDSAQLDRRDSNENFEAEAPQILMPANRDRKKVAYQIFQGQGVRIG